MDLHKNSYFKIFISGTLVIPNWGNVSQMGYCYPFKPGLLNRSRPFIFFNFYKKKTKKNHTIIIQLTHLCPMAFQEHAEIPLCPLFETWLKSKSFCLHTTPFSNFAPFVKLREKEIGEFSLDIIYCPKFFTLQITFIYMCCIFVYAVNAYRCGKKRCQPATLPKSQFNQKSKYCMYLWEF